MERRPALLFVAPILPAAGGNGLAMRAGVFLDALVQDFDVTLLVVPVAGSAGAGSTGFAAGRARRVLTVALEGKVDPRWALLSRVAGADARATALAAQLSVPLLARAWQMLVKGIEEAGKSGQPLAAAEMVLIRLAYTADLPTPDELIRQYPVRSLW